MKNKKITTEILPWSRASRELTALRKRIFVQEQKVPPEHELDGKDPEMIHIALRIDGKLAGCARMDKEGRIGRVAVEKEFRGMGLGRILMDGLEQKAILMGLKEVRLNAQKGALDFYRKLGYLSCGEDFIEAGISHRPLKKSLPPFDNSLTELS